MYRSSSKRRILLLIRKCGYEKGGFERLYIYIYVLFVIYILREKRIPLKGPRGVG
jgi:hypothetical protein